MGQINYSSHFDTTNPSNPININRNLTPGTSGSRCSSTMSPTKLHELFEMLSHDTGIDTSRVFRNFSVANLYEDALKYEEGTVITSNGALATFSGAKTGRSPKDKRIVEEHTSKNDVWWGPVNMPIDEHTFDINRERAVDYLKTRKRIYVFDGFAGWDPKYRLKIRVICARAYHGTPTR